MAGEIQLNSTSFASESSGTITINNATLASAVDLSNHYASTSEVQGTHTTGSITSGTTALTVASATGISTGDYVVGEGITPGTTVTAGGGTTSLTLSANAGATLSSDPVSFYKADKVLSPGLVGSQLCRAWINFNGSTDVIRASYNVSSLTESSGVYTITFTTSMSDSNYAVSGSGSAGDNNGKMVSAKTFNTGSVVVVAPYHDNGLVADVTYFCVAVFR